MLRILVAYLCTGVVFLVLDASWLTFAGPKLYKPEIGVLLADKVRLAPAAVFYLLYVAGLVYFCVAPNAAAGWRNALLSGAILGLVAYGAYDLTCQAVMTTWSTKITVGDMVWGAFASGVASVAGLYASRFAAKTFS